jgi:homoserine kinase type II
VAVYTHVSSEDIATFLLRFDVGALRMAKGIAEGVENSNYLIETDKARFILTLYEKRVNVDDLPFFLGLTTHLAEAGLPVPKAVSDTGGQQLQTLAGKPACLIQFLSGISVTEPTPAHCLALGKALASIHLATATFSPERPNSLSVGGWQELVVKISTGADRIQPGLAEVLRETYAHVAARWPSDLPRGAIHADLFPDNVLFTGTDISGLIDFYFACTDFYAYDLAVCLNAWSFSNDGTAYFQHRANAVLDGYQQVRPLSTAEQGSLAVLCQGAALRFLLTRAYDWLNTPADALVTRKDPLAYLRRLEHYLETAG